MMVTIQSADLESASETPGFGRLTQFEEFSIGLTPRIEAALRALLEAFDYAQDLGRSLWDFAVEISSLRRLDLSKSDMRWLVGKGLVEYAIEVTVASDSERSFRQPMRPLFCKKACFVLAPRGLELARAICGRAEPAGRVGARAALQSSRLAIAAVSEPLVPKWDRDRQELRVGSIVVKQFKVPAANQEAILAAFEEESWPTRIDDPLPPHGEQSPKRRLQETIKSLNRNQKQSLIRFLGDGSGQGVRWEFCGDDDGLRKP